MEQIDLGGVWFPWTKAFWIKIYTLVGLNNQTLGLKVD